MEREPTTAADVAIVLAAMLLVSLAELITCLAMRGGLRWWAS